MSKIDPLRHMEVFSPYAFGQKRIDVIGAGATGSRIVVELAKLGIENIHVWDFDTVEEHNIPNQVFGREHIGMLKVDALQQFVQQQTGTVITIHPQRVEGGESFGEVVFLLTDSMESRKQIWLQALKYKMRTNLLIETRMGADNGRIYTLNPNKPVHIKAWESTLYTDQEAEVSACGASTSVGSTAAMIAGLATWQLITWFAREQGKEKELDNEIIFAINPLMIVNRRF